MTKDEWDEGYDQGWEDYQRGFAFQRKLGRPGSEWRKGYRQAYQDAAVPDPPWWKKLYRRHWLLDVIEATGR